MADERPPQPIKRLNPAILDRWPIMRLTAAEAYGWTGNWNPVPQPLPVWIPPAVPIGRGKKD